MLYEELKSYLFSLKHYGATYGIDRMKVLNDAIGDPSKNFHSIHIAGTNGKGSTSSMLSSVYMRSGYKVGLFTSPHIIDVRERIQINGMPISKADFIRIAESLISLCQKIKDNNLEDSPSFFEFINAIAFIYFKEQEVDVAIIETGLGGEKDCTNVLMPLVCAITSIGYDHQAILGNTLEDIAQAKAGIIKPNTPVVIGDLCKEAESVIKREAKKKNARLYAIEAPYQSTNLAGNHQQVNASIVSKVVEYAQHRLPVSAEDLYQGLQQVKCPARWQLINFSENTKLILDTAHNQDSLVAARDNLNAYINCTGEKISLIYGSLNKESYALGLKYLEPYVDSISLVKVNNFRGIDSQLLFDSLSEGAKKRATTYSMQKIAKVLNDRKGTFLVTGSIYLIGELLSELYPNKTLFDILD